MCVYNAWPYVRQAVESTLSQQGVSFEFVIVNDGSTDETSGYLNQLKDSRIRLIQTDNQGIAAAANLGLKYCKGSYIARFDADDVMGDNRLQMQAKFLSEYPSVDVVAGCAELLDAVHQQEGFQRFVTWNNTLLSHEQMKVNRFRDATLVNPTVMLRALVFQKYGNYLLNGPEDYEFWMRLFSQNVQFAKLPQSVLLWRDLSSRLTRSHLNYSEEAFLQVKVEYFLRDFQGEKSIYIWGKNRNGKRWEEELRKRHLKVSGFVDFKRGEWKNLPVLSMEEAVQDQDRFFIITVRDRTGSRLIEVLLKNKGFQLGEDFIFT